MTMKNIKSILIIAFSLICAVTFAQEKKELKAIPDGWMPQQGDIALGISAKPLLKYVGNIFNGSESNGLNSFGGQAYGGVGFDNLDAIANGVSPLAGAAVSAIKDPLVSLQGKYQILDNVALRGNFGFIGANFTYQTYSPDDKALVLDPMSNELVIDAMKIKLNGGSFAVGAEYQKRYRKIQGYVGANLLYAFASGNLKYTYGNAMTEINHNPSSAVPGIVIPFPSTNPYGPDDYLENARPLEDYSVKSVNAFGVVGNVGIEYFFAPKISIGGEVNLSFIHLWQPQTFRKYEGWNPATQKVEEYTQLVSPGNKANLYGTGNLGGNIFVNFYF